jgi:hypothetical protein
MDSEYKGKETYLDDFLIFVLTILGMVLAPFIGI